MRIAGSLVLTANLFTQVECPKDDPLGSGEGTGDVGFEFRHGRFVDPRQGRQSLLGQPKAQPRPCIHSPGIWPSGSGLKPRSAVMAG